MTERHISAKKAWARMSERAMHGEKFGFIAALALLHKTGVLTRKQVVEQLNAGQITRVDLERFRRDDGKTPRG